MRKLETSGNVAARDGIIRATRTGTFNGRTMADAAGAWLQPVQIDTCIRILPYSYSSPSHHTHPKGITMQCLILSGGKRHARLRTGAAGAPVNVVTFFF